MAPILALRLLTAALILGVLGDLLLRARPWGVNVPLWLLGVATAAAIFYRRTGSEGRPRLAVGALLLLSSLSFVLRDSTALHGLALLAAAASAVGILLAAQSPLRRATLGEYADAALGLAASVVEGFAPLASGARAVVAGRRWSVSALAFARGVLLSAPLLFLFGGLLVAADPAFNAIVTELLRIDYVEVLGHGFGSLVFAWLASALLGILVLRREHPAYLAGSKVPSLGLTEVATALSLLNVLFLGFVLVQIRYLFGGAPLVEVTPGLTYAEYARRGFFELVWVAALVLPVLLSVDLLLGGAAPRARRVFRALAGLQVGLLLVVLTSAAQRMRLYLAEFGWTEQRLYASAFMVWLAVVFLWFAASVLRGDRKRFSFGAWSSALAMIAVLHAANPDAGIVRTNVARALDGHELDAAYAASLSDDAVPALLEALPSLPAATRCALAEALLRRTATEADWRSWNLARQRARRLLDERRPHLFATALRDCYAAGSSEGGSL